MNTNDMYWEGIIIRMKIQKDQFFILLEVEGKLIF